jgi:serine/threonine protein kinase
MEEYPQINTGYVRLSRPAVLLRMIHENISPTNLRSRRKAGISGETWQRVLDEEKIRYDSAFAVAEALHISLLSLLHHTSLLELTQGKHSFEPGPGLPDWCTDEPCRYGEASNGLKYFVWKLKHRLERDCYARGKRYDLAELPATEQERVAHYLARHGEVCRKVKGLPWFPLHYTVAPDPNGMAWWCVDDWTPGKTLADLIFYGGIAKANVAAIMRNIAKGLQSLHEAGVIYREMTTISIIVSNAQQGTVVLTDFELGKLLDGRPTVRGSRPGNLYQPPEIDGKHLTADDTHVDWYSWGRVLLHAVTGGLPPLHQHSPVVEQAELPDRVKKLVARCLSPDPSVRPRKGSEILNGIRWWR